MSPGIVKLVKGPCARRLAGIPRPPVVRMPIPPAIAESALNTLSTTALR
jgi:hypothetical protein